MVRHANRTVRRRVLVDEHHVAVALHDLERIRHVRRARDARRDSISFRDRPPASSRDSCCAARAPPADTGSCRLRRRSGPAAPRTARRAARIPAPPARRPPSRFQYAVFIACQTPLTFGWPLMRGRARRAPAYRRHRPTNPARPVSPAGVQAREEHARYKARRQRRLVIACCFEPPALLFFVLFAVDVDERRLVGRQRREIRLARQPLRDRVSPWPALREHAARSCARRRARPRPRDWPRGTNTRRSRSPAASSTSCAR